MRNVLLVPFLILLAAPPSGLSAQVIPTGEVISLLRPAGLEPEVAEVDIAQDSPAVVTVPGGFVVAWSYDYRW